MKVVKITWMTDDGEEEIQIKFGYVEDLKAEVVEEYEIY